MLPRPRPARGPITHVKRGAQRPLRAVRMCVVAGEKYPPGPVLVRHPLVDPKPGSPDHLSHPYRLTTRPPGVEQSLRIGDVRLLWGIVDFGHEPERPVQIGR